MTRIEAVIKNLNKFFGEAGLPHINFTRYGICTKITGKFNQSENALSYIWDVLKNDWVYFSANSPILYHVLTNENILPTEYPDEICSIYKFTTTFIYDRSIEYSSSQVAEWLKRRFLDFNSDADAFSTQISGNYTADLSHISYESEQNYFSEFPITSENYTPDVVCIKTEWTATLNYNACSTVPKCEYENFC